MTAYWIATYDEITDPEKVAAYAALAGPALMAKGGRFLARGNPEQTYEVGEATRTCPRTPRSRPRADDLVASLI